MFGKKKEQELFIVEDTRVETKEFEMRAEETQVAAVGVEDGYIDEHAAVPVPAAAAQVAGDHGDACEDEGATAYESARASQAGMFAAEAQVAQADVIVKDTIVDQRIVEEVIPVARKRHRRRWLLLPLLLALLLLLLMTGIAFASTTATITLTLEQHTLAETVVVSQSAQSISTKGVLAHIIPSPLVYVPGSHAQGWLTLKSSGGSCGCATVVPAGTEFRGADGVWVMTESSAALGPNCTVTVPAMALPDGPSGNIRARDIHSTYGKTISVVNAYAFSGGTNGSWQRIVQPFAGSQIVAHLTAQLNRTLSAKLNGQAKHLGLTSLSQRCYSRPFINQAAGAFAPNVTISVSMTCSTQGYNPQSVLAQAKQLFQQQAQAAFGNDFALTNLMNATVSNVFINPKTGNVVATVAATGQWTYQLQTAQKQEIAGMLTGKDLDDAVVFLKEQRGIVTASISSGGFMNTLPIMAKNITIVTQN